MPRVEKIEQPVYVPNYVNKEVPTVVAQKLQPVIRQVSKVRKVSCKVTEPKIITVDVFIPKPVASSLGVGGKIAETHKTVDVPGQSSCVVACVVVCVAIPVVVTAAQYNALIKRLNISLDPSHVETLFVKEGAGVPILPAGERVETVEPVSGDWAGNHEMGKIHCSNATSVPGIHVHETLGVSRSFHGAPRGFNDLLSTQEESTDPTMSQTRRHHHRHRHHRRRRTSSTEASSPDDHHHNHRHQHRHHKHRYSSRRPEDKALKH